MSLSNSNFSWCMTFDKKYVWARVTADWNGIFLPWEGHRWDFFNCAREVIFSFHVEILFFLPFIFNTDFSSSSCYQTKLKMRLLKLFPAFNDRQMICCCVSWCCLGWSKISYICICEQNKKKYNDDMFKKRDTVAMMSHFYYTWVLTYLFI